MSQGTDFPGCAVNEINQKIHGLPSEGMRKSIRSASLLNYCYFILTIIIVLIKELIITVETVV
jgi:hypothetical protein